MRPSPYATPVAQLAERLPQDDPRQHHGRIHEARPLRRQLQTMSELSDILAAFAEDRWQADDRATPTELSELQKRWAALPGDFMALLLPAGRAKWQRCEDQTLRSEVSAALQHPGDQAVAMLADMMLIGVDAGAYWYFHDPNGVLGRGEWAAFVVRQATSQLISARFALSSITHVLARLLAGEKIIARVVLLATR